jgi:uncharacterized protein (TIGR02466 family)
MKEPKILGIFPTPVYWAKLERPFSAKEHKYFTDHRDGSNLVDNVGNTSSKDNYILNRRVFASLKKELSTHVKNYFDKVLCTKDVTPWITQSWLNYTRPDQFHHRHAHPNSFVSGVLYINADNDNDKILFYKSSLQYIKPQVTSFNIYNSESWFFHIKTNDLVLFPSTLTHAVEQKTGNNTRISLAFNVFVKGRLGDPKELTELKL